MTKQVNFESQERVDLGDMAVVTGYAADELRKLVRYLVTGEGNARIVRGFLVEPENSGVSPRVKVRMNFGGAELGTFAGALGLPGNIFDFGQLAGGHDAQGALDGAAQLLLDFTGQPAAVYDVKIRATFLAGATDNRAFWNASTNAEFVKTAQTRLLPQWELAFSGHADPDWVLIGTVSWGGATVSTSDITDARDLALEGRPRADPSAAVRWSHADQAESNAALVRDFDRGVDRAGAAGVSSLWAGFRALARQVQDIKGGRELDGRIDWYSRVFPPAGGGLDPQQTKTLRTLETVTFTVGEALDQGDFNGVSGIRDCFAYIAANSAALPRRIRILVKNRRTIIETGVPTYGWSAPVVIADHDIVLQAVGNGFRNSVTNAPVSGSPTGLCDLVPTITGSQVMLTLTNGSLEIEDFYVHGMPATAGVFSLGVESSFRARRCFLQMPGSFDSTTTGYVLRCSHQNLRLSECSIAGVLWIGGRPTPSASSHETRGIIRNCAIFGYLNARLHDWSGASAADRWLFADGLVIEDSILGDFTLSNPREGGNIDLTGASNVTIRNCKCLVNGDQDFIGLSHAQIFAATFVPSSGIKIEKNVFQMWRSSTHAAYAGAAVLEGTGWAVKSIAVRNFGTVTSASQLPTGIVIRHNTFLTRGFVSSPDAGAVAVFDSRNSWVHDNEITEWTEPNAGGATQYLIAVISSASGIANSAGQHIWVTDNFVGQFVTTQAVAQQWGGAGGKLCCIGVSGVLYGRVSGNVVSAAAETGGILDPTTDLAPAALQVINCSCLDVVGNRLLFWRSGSNPLISTCAGISGLIIQVRLIDNVFLACGGLNFTRFGTTAVNGLVIRGNEFYVGTAASQFSGAVDLSGSTPVNNLHVQHNSWDYDGSGGTQLAVHVGPATQFSTFGNYFRKGIIQHATLGGTASVTSFGYGLLAGQAFPNDSFNFLDSPGYT